MPLFYQHNINDTAKLALWHITEAEDFFLQKIQLQKHIRHTHKRLQHLAGRYLLQLLYPAFPVQLIDITTFKKPSLPDQSFHFSISHCGDFAAAIISEDTMVGIDVELITPKIELIKNKFLTADELRVTPNVSNTFYAFLWSCKEAVYKWYGKGGVDFKKDIVITGILMNDTNGTVACSFRKEQNTALTIEVKIFENLCLAWVVK